MVWIIVAIAVLIMLALSRLGTTTPPDAEIDQSMRGQRLADHTPMPTAVAHDTPHVPPPAGSWPAIAAVYHVVEIDYCMTHKGVRYHGEQSSPWCQWHALSDDDCDLVSLARMDTR